MGELLLAVAVFLVTHLLAAVRPLRAALVRVMGERAYIIGFSLVSLALVVWLGFAYAAAPYVELWPYMPELRWIPLLVMPVACVLIVAGLMSRNPFSLGAGAEGYDAARPGIVVVTRHPAVWGLVLWSLVHIPVNGDAASLILFGLLSLLGVGGPKSLDAKRKRTLGEAQWQALLAQTRETSAMAGLAQAGMIRIAAGLVLYGLLLLAHEAVIGIDPFPV